MIVREAVNFKKQIQKSLEALERTFGVTTSHYDYRLSEDGTAVIAFTARIIVNGFEYGSSLTTPQVQMLTHEEIAANLIGQGLGQYMWQNKN